MSANTLHLYLKCHFAFADTGHLYRNVKICTGKAKARLEKAFLREQHAVCFQTADNPLSTQTVTVATKTTLFEVEGSVLCLVVVENC